MFKRGIVHSIFLLCLMGNATLAQSESASVEEMSKKRQDPVSGLRSVFLQELLLPVGDGTASSFSVQPVYPFKLGSNLKLITYTIIPFQSLPPITPDGTHEGGMGNILFNGYFSSIAKKGKLSWGLGPALQIPTRTNSALGSSCLSMGPTALLYYAGDKISAGIVVQNYWSLGGEGDNRVNSGSLQYIAYYNFSAGWFVESNATIIANWLASSNDRWLIPLGGGPGKTFKIGDKSKLFYSAATQAFYNVEKPEYVGDWQAIFQFQVIF
ncbi:hypothetical protein EYY60_16160 [Flavobacterium zhairuonense]|uniref:hypothetical protein n=1 Tax=Flavobacterium zhairuonense TaxID=2493631 RepID=UPI0010455CA6|nr:hypothetical protein [Flavobacterium zhairuonense]KAF2508658.1 hypothetical protein EYY60_16160 [Flavobacterium zhairuonense]